ncbi:MAG: cation diffusion facilitator family transporter [Deltaproteobacteria bacterium]|nr:cation diffusion facilitator family transporter [Deltaproteobacteria bacterium]
MLKDSLIERSREVKRVLWVTLFLNLLVCGLKLGYGYSSHSLSMVADGYHSLLDSTSNIVGLIALFFAAKPADSGHPYGHRKVEALGAMFISAMLFWACYEIVSSAVQRVHTHQTPEVTVYSFLIMVGTMGVNAWVSKYEHRRGHELHSQILTADSAHTRSDVYASLSVIAALIGVKFHIPWVDLGAAGLIAVFVGYSGYKIVLESLDTLMDSAQLDAREVLDIVMKVPGVEKCHSIRTRGNPAAIYMDLNIHVAPHLSTQESHAITHQVIAKIKEEIPEVIDVVVHTEPSSPHED